MRETEDLRIHLETGLAQIGDAVEREAKTCKDLVQHAEEDLAEAIKRDKKEIKEKAS